MRYVLAAALVVCACTRAKPDAIGGNGAGGGGGVAGSGGNGGGGNGGGGNGNGGGHDMAMSMPDDMTAPADMTSFVGVFCGTMTCVAPDNECCAVSGGPLTCQSPSMQCNGAPYDCDGPEDCLKDETCCGGGTGSTCNQLNGGGCPGGRVPLCHTLDDCPKTNGGFVACCPSPQGGHIHFCSKNPC